MRTIDYIQGGALFRVDTSHLVILRAKGRLCYNATHSFLTQKDSWHENRDWRRPWRI